MQRMILKTTTTGVDQELGTFVARISGWSADRDGDTIDRHAFDRTVSAWQSSGKQIPLLHEHSTTAIGSLDPATMETDEKGLIVAGEVDREIPEGRQTWKMIKRGRRLVQHRVHGGEVPSA